MAEDPIKLFSTRAERYPGPTDTDVALGAGRAALAAIPFVGGSITEVLSLILAPAVARRRDTWLKELADALDEAERRIEGFSVQNLVQNEAFVSAVIEATRSVTSTHRYEKRDALRSALLNIVLRHSTDEDQEQLFLRYIDELTPSHLSVLKQCRTEQEMHDRDEFNIQIVADLSARGLLSTADGAKHMVLAESDGRIRACATPWGVAFLNFITDPLA